MSDLKSQFGWLNDARLSAHALMPTPVWLFSTDGRHLLWANPVGAAIFEAASSAQAGQITLDSTHPAAMQVGRLAITLPDAGAPRLERLRGFGARLGGVLVCLCSRITLGNNMQAVLIVSTERAGIELTLPERAERLLVGMTQTAVIFSADGQPIAGTAEARDVVSGKHDLIELGAEKLARGASLNGIAEGDTLAGPVAIMKLGAGATVSLLVLFGRAAARPAPAPSIAADVSPPPPAIEETPIEQVRHFVKPIETNSIAPSAPVTDLRRPHRFVWQMDADMRLIAGVGEFTRLTGLAPAVFDQSWFELAATLGLDPRGEIASALKARETWSGIAVPWPVADSGERLSIEMSGLPVFDRDRQFAGYRGFGVMRGKPAFERKDAPPSAPEARKIVPFPAAPAPVAPIEAPVPVEPMITAPTLTPGERSNFQELARELSARLKAPQVAAGDDAELFAPSPLSPPPLTPAPPLPPLTALPDAPPAARAGEHGDSRPILDRLPVGLLVYKLNHLVYANRAFLDWTGYATLEALTEAGGLDSLFIENKDPPPDEPAPSRNGAKTLTITTVNGQQKAVEGKLFSMPWNGENALVLMINTQPPVSDDRARLAEAQVRQLEEEKSELKAVLDTAADGVLLLDRAGRVLSANRSAQALFGYDPAHFGELSLHDLFVPESRRSLMETLDRLSRERGASALDPGREALGRVKQGGVVPLFVSMGVLVGDDKICAVVRDMTAWKRTEEELIKARRDAERASTAKSEFLAKISHEIRTPLNAIIGFSEVMMDERFGALGNDRYKQYLKDIHASGGHLISLLNDLLDLSKIEAGKLDLSLVSIDLNALVQQCVAIMQDQANRERVIIRTSLAPNLPPIIADARSVRQIALNILSNSIKFTGAGGQVIVSTSREENNEVALRVRDTGVGMSEKELQTALEPFRQLATAARWGTTGTGLGLPITKALAEANHARFRITSQVQDGTLVEVAFPATRVLA